MVKRGGQQQQRKEWNRSESTRGGKGISKTPSETGTPGHMSPAFLFVLMSLVGYKVIVTMKNGKQFKGIFHTASVGESDLGVCLKMARRVGDEEEKGETSEDLILLGKDVLAVSATGVEIAPEFATDTAISGGGGAIASQPKERELHKWTAEDVANEGQVSLELNEQPHGGQWDQFAVNEKLFGVTTDYREEIYTTVLDTSSADFKEREKRALRIAAEIQGTATTNVHLAEERGAVIDEKQTNEEDRYGAVIRNQQPAAAAKEATTEAAKPRTMAQVAAAKTTAASLPKEEAPKRTEAVNEEALKKLMEKTRIESSKAAELKDYNMKEKDRIAKKKMELMRKEKMGILNEFKSFSASFKLNTPVPEDLAEILKIEKKHDAGTPETSTPLSSNTPEKSKDSPKQETPVNKETKEEATGAVAEEPKEAEQQQQEQEQQPKKTSFKFNVAAMEFKPTPSAGEFSPNPATSTTSSERSHYQRRGRGGSSYRGGKHGKHQQHQPQMYEENPYMLDPSQYPVSYPMMPMGQYPRPYPFAAAGGARPMPMAPVPYFVPPGAYAPAMFNPMMQGIPAGMMYPENMIPMMPVYPGSDEQQKMCSQRTTIQHLQPMNKVRRLYLCNHVSNQKMAEQIVTPWDVKGAEVDGQLQAIDYSILIEKFGTRPIDQALLDRLEQLTGKKPHHLLRRVIQLTDDEKFLFRQGLTLEDANKYAYENAKDIAAFGFDPKKTLIFSDFDSMSGAFYRNVVRISKCITTSQSKATFGFSDSDCIGKLHFVSVQAAPSFSNTFPEIFGPKGDVPCLIPCAIDQDPYFRLTRDVASKLKYPKPSLLHAQFFPALQGPGTKMSASNLNSAVFLTDTAAQIKNKINRHAFSGGGATAEEHKEKGGNPAVDVSFQYLRFFLEDDEELAAIEESYRKGQLSTSDLKKRCIEIVQKIVADVQEKRKTVTDEQLALFMDPKYPRSVSSM